MSSLDELLAELSQVLLALDETDESDSHNRAKLEGRRDELRRTLRKIDLDEQRPTSELLEERTRLEARVNTARSQRVKKIPGKYLGATQTVGGGVEPVEINRMIDEANQLDELVDRLDRLTEILESREAL